MPFSFPLPPELNAPSPPERRGLRRDQVRLLLLPRTGGLPVHDRFSRLGDHLRPGDLLVLNNSRTLPAVLPATGVGGAPVEVRLAHRRGPDSWLALLRSASPLAPSARLEMAGGLAAEVTDEPAPPPLRLLRFSRRGADLYDSLYRVGAPIRYEYVTQPWDLEYYQTVFASVPGSVEMPSAGRAFTWELLLALRRRGVRIAFLSLHAGLSYYLDDRWPKNPADAPEEYQIPAETASAVAQTRAAGGRVVAVGTTVVRALESAAEGPGLVRAGAGWAGAYIGPGYRLQATDGLLTGLHEPEASHLDLLAALVEPDRLITAYAEAVREGYLWHEFGDLNLIL